MNYCVKHNEQCDSADASGHCNLTACNRYLLITDEAPTVDAIPIEWIKQFIKKENIHISNKVGIVHMVEQWKLHPIDFEISSEPQWIPVSKKLPNKNDYVIVTTKFGVVIEAQFEIWNSGAKEWWIDNDNSFEFDDVVAWMPMPQPYRGG